MNTKNAPETAVSTKQASVYEQPAFKSDRHSIIDDEEESEYGVVIDNDDEDDEEQDVLSSLELPSEWKNEDDAINSDGNTWCDQSDDNDYDNDDIKAENYEEMKEELMSYKKALKTKKLQNHYLQQLIQRNNQRYSAEINALKQQNQQYLMQQETRFICNDNANQYTVNNDTFYTARKMDRILINDDQQYDDAVIQAIYLMFEYLTAYMTVTCLFWDHQIMLFFENMANHHNVMTELDEDLYISDDEEMRSEDEDEEYIVITSSMDLPSDWEEDMMDKYVSETNDDERRETEHAASSVDNVYQKKSASEALPGKYCYQPHECDAKMIVYGEDDDGTNNKSQNSLNNKNNKDNKNNINNNNKQNDNNDDDNNNGSNDNSNCGKDGDKNNDKNNRKKGGKKDGDDVKEDEDEDEDEEKNDETKEKEEEEMEEDMDPKRIYRIPYKLTKQKDKASMIAEAIDDIYNYMIDSLRILTINTGIYQLPNGERIINFNFHDKDSSTEIVYGVAKKANGDRNFKWKFDGILYRADQLQQLNLYGFEKRKLPKSPMSQIANHKYEVTVKLMESINNILYKTKWCKKMVYNNINNKKQSNKKRITLSLTREAFTQHIKKYNNIKQMNGVDLIPIMVGNNSKCWLEYVWIVAIEQDVDIGISFKYESKGHIQVTGIYLDKQMLLRHHRLVLPYHKCHCLEDRFKSNKITCLEIGNVVAKENKLKDLSKRYEGLKQKNVDLEEENVDLRKENEILRKALEKWKKAMTLKQSASDLCLDVDADELLMANPEDIELQESKIEENDNVSTDIIIPTDDALSFPTKKLTESDDEDDEDNDIVDDDNDDKDAINPSTETTTPTPQNVDPPQPQQPIPMLNLLTIPTISQSIPFQPSISIPPLTPQYSLSALSIPMPCNSLLTATSSISSLPSPMTPQFSYPLPTVNGNIYNYNLLQQMNPLQITPMGAVSPYFQFPGQNVMNISTPNGSLQPLLNQQQQISRNTPYI